MTIENCVAVVVGPEQMRAFTGVEGLHGACLINEGVGQCFIFMTKEELMTAVADYDVCPSGYTSKVALLDADAELEAVAQIADFAMSQSAQLAAVRKAGEQAIGYVDFGPRYYRGVLARLTTFGLDMMIGVKLAESLGLQEGDKVNLTVSPCSNFFAIERSDAGPELTRPMNEPEHYVLDRVFSNVPLFVELSDTDWNTVPYHLLDDRILISSDFKPATVHDKSKKEASVEFSRDRKSEGARSGKQFPIVIGLATLGVVALIMSVALF